MAKGGAKKGSKRGKGGDHAFDVLTLVGLILALFLMWFGVTFVEKPSPDDANYEEAMESYSQTGPFAMNKLGGFVDYPSIAITVGGTIASLMVSFPITTFKRIPKQMKIAFNPTVYDTQSYIAQITDFAKEARSKGLLSLEDKLQGVSDNFLRSSLMLVVDSVEPEKVHSLLESELDQIDDRHNQAISFYEKGAAYAPGFGMIGTLIGLVNMLADMSDAASIGPAMATALLTTLYGSMLGNIFFNPMANKLRIRHEEEMLCKTLICEGVEAIQAGENPRFIEEKLQMLVLQEDSGKKKKGKKGKGAPARDEDDEE
ncbi:MAG: motility protein A [Oscillospiraceae bacterium]|nr:motility protein A [Oscillospiraceae bacterium]